MLLACVFPYFKWQPGFKPPGGQDIAGRYITMPYLSMGYVGL